MQNAKCRMQNEKNKNSVPRGGKNKELTCVFYINGEQVERLTEEQTDKMAERLSKAMSRYYTARPDEYIALVRQSKERT